MQEPHTPTKQGLYDPSFDHDSCGVGFIVHLKGEPSHKIVQDGVAALENLFHRGACGCEANTGDGAGVLIQVPHEFLKEECSKLGIALPAAGQYGVGTLFVPKDEAVRDEVFETFSRIVEEEGQRALGWRRVPTNNEEIGASALAAEPWMYQALVGRGSDDVDEA